MNRREFLKTAGIIGIGSLVSVSYAVAASPQISSSAEESATWGRYRPTQAT